MAKIEIELKIDGEKQPIKLPKAKTLDIATIGEISNQVTTHLMNAMVRETADQLAEQNEAEIEAARIEAEQINAEREAE
ncbi:hypothetical protein PBI_TRISCUIT_86 [Microbacterium phage Triscuit]|nr:hypothetical protein PBI_TRISCUIT_86 [Microbacterium phage Triscuit]